MSNVPNKVFIKIESTAEQQENLKNTRKTLKVLQKAGVDKENLAGRPIKTYIKGKIDSDTFASNELAKRKKVDSRSTQTETIKEESSQRRTITEEDLTSIANPGEAYWELLSEKRREALEDSLVENKRLHDRIDGLEEELNTSRQMLDEARNLVEVLQEILAEREDDEDELNKGASTSRSEGQAQEKEVLDETLPSSDDEF